MDTAGYRKWWEVKVYQGKDARGGKVGVEAFRNMETGEICAPENGWSGAPPNGEDGITLVHNPSDLYRQNYDQIRWDKDGHSHDPNQEVLEAQGR